MIHMNLVKRIALGFFLSASIAGAGFAQGASVALGVKDHDTSTPVEITSEQLELNQEQGTATFEQNVFVRQGDMTLTCDKMTVEYGTNPSTGAEEITNIRMSGGVTFASPTETAESNSAVYSLTAGTLIMQGDVLVTQGRTALSSDKLTYNLDSGAGVMEGNVKTVLQQASN